MLEFINKLNCTSKGKLNCFSFSRFISSGLKRDLKWLLARVLFLCPQTRFIEQQEVVELKDNIYIDMQAGRNLLPKLPVADN